MSLISINFLSPFYFDVKHKATRSRGWKHNLSNQIGNGEWKLKHRGKQNSVVDRAIKHSRNLSESNFTVNESNEDWASRGRRDRNLLQDEEMTATGASI